MGITYTISGDGASLDNFPNTEGGSLSPNDLTVTAATPTSLTIAVQGDGFSLEAIFTGQFSNIDSVVGQPFGDATQTLVGSIATEVTTITIGDAQHIDRFTYDPPATIQPTTTFDQTLGELQIEWGGDDVFIGDRTNAQNDSIYGYGGNDRFVMTYSDQYTEKFRGGDGVDTAVFESASEYWNISPTDSAWNMITQQGDLVGYNVSDSRFEGTDTYGGVGHILQIVEVERLEFTDAVLELSNGEWVEVDPSTDEPITPAPITPAPITPAPITPAPINSDTPSGTHSLTLIADVFGSIIFLKDLTEVVSSTSHTIYHAGSAFDYDDIDSFVTTVIRNDQFTAEFQSEIAESFPTQANINYQTAVALIGQANIEATLLAVAGADGNYVG